MSGCYNLRTWWAQTWVTIAVHGAPMVEADKSAAPGSAAVLAALNEIVSSPTFVKAERPARFLRHLVETGLKGETHRLKESVLGVEVFGRPANWDPRLDAIVRQEAARLRKRLARYYEAAGPKPVRIELPVGSYVPVFHREPAQVEAVAEDRVSAVGPSALRKVGSQKRRFSVLVVFLCAAGAVAFSWFLRHREETKLTADSVVVLPFANLSPNAGDQYFADGLTDEITDSLARLRGLRVVARSSAFQFKGKTVDIREVGRLLNVGNVVEGSVQRLGERIRIVAHLERVTDGSHIWSNTFEGGTADLFTVQSEVAAGVAASLKAGSGAGKGGHVPNAEAHNAVLKAMYEMQQLTPDSLARVEADYQRAIDLDPGYAEAYMGLGRAKYNEYIARGSTQQTEAERRSAEQLFRRALALDPEMSAAHAFLGALAMYDWNWAQAERELRGAAAGPSSATAEGYYAMFLIFHGRFAEADQHLRKMSDLDPFSSVTMNTLLLARNLEGRFAQSREISQRVAAQFPKMLSPQQMITLTYVEEGRPDLAFPAARKLEQQFPPAQIFEAMAYAKAGRRDEALKIARPFEEKYPASGVSMQWLALVYAFMEDEANTLKWLERSADRHEWQALNLAVHPAYRFMQNSPRYRALKQRMGLASVGR